MKRIMLMLAVVMFAYVAKTETVTVDTNTVNITTNTNFIKSASHWSIVNTGDNTVFVRPNVDTLVISNAIPIPPGYTYTGNATASGVLVYNIKAATTNGTSTITVAFE